MLSSTFPNPTTIHQNNPIKNVGIPQEMTDAINAQILQDALRDDGPFEIEYYQVAFNYGNGADNTTFNITYSIFYFFEI